MKIFFLILLQITCVYSLACGVPGSAGNSARHDPIIIQLIKRKKNYSRDIEVV